MVLEKPVTTFSPLDGFSLLTTPSLVSSCIYGQYCLLSSLTDQFTPVLIMYNSYITIPKDERRIAEIRRIREIFVPELVLRLHQELMVSRHLFPACVILLPANLPYLTAPDALVINYEFLFLDILSIVLAHAIHEPHASIHDRPHCILICFG